MKYLRCSIFLLCLAAWGWWGWHYGAPLAVAYHDLLADRQGPIIAKLSWFGTLMVLLYVYYAAAMNFKRVMDNKTAPPAMSVVGYTLVLPPGLFLDWLANMLLTIFMFNPPKHPTELVTGRLERYSKDPKAHWWHRGFAKGMGYLLHALDPRGWHF